ncbi:hypothetical protein, partial [Burkholderia pseudomallei]|uniref:hypothetical protein n=1 Tax=Burkholderia pseudomallei TaxID=28450 RepID=UPI001955D6FC
WPAHAPAIAAAAFARSPSSPAGFLDGALFMHWPPAARAPIGAVFRLFHIVADSCVFMQICERPMHSRKSHSSL